MKENHKISMLLPVCFTLLFALFMTRTILRADVENYNIQVALCTNIVIISMLIVATLLCWLKNFQIFSVLAAVFILLTIGSAYQSLFGALGYMGHAILSFCAMVLGFLLIRYHSDFTNSEYAMVTVGILVLLIMNLLFGASTRADTDSALWVSFGGLSFQPGELIRVLLILQASMSYRRKSRAIIYSICAIISAGVLLILHDFGGAAVILVLFLVATYQLLDNRLLTCGLILSGLICFLVLLLSNSYAIDRFLATGKALEGTEATQQGKMIKMVLFSGVFGTGLSDYSNAVQDIYSSESDLALAGVQVVFGIPVLIIVMFAYCALIIQVARNKSVYPSGHLLPMQLALMTSIQVMLNYCGSLDVLPFTGITAPFISRGGSSMVTYGLIIGMSAGGFCPAINQRRLYFCRKSKGRGRKRRMISNAEK